MLIDYEEIYDEGKDYKEDEYTSEDVGGREIWTATLSGLCQIHYTRHPKDPVDFYMTGLTPNSKFVGEIKNREKLPSWKKEKYNTKGWMYEEWKDKNLKWRMQKNGAKDALFITITDDYIYIWLVGHKKFEWGITNCTATTATNYHHGEKPKSCTYLRIEDARWKIKR